MGFFSFQPTSLLVATTIVSSYRAIRSNHSVAGDARVVVLVQNISDCTECLRPSRRACDLFVRHRLTFRDSTHDLVDGFSERSHIDQASR